MRRAVRRGPTGLAQRRHARRHDRTYRSPADKTSRAFGPPTPPRNHAGDAQAHPACDGGTRTPRPRPPPHRHRNTGSNERLICEKYADQVTARPPDSPGRTSDCPAAPRESTHIREASAQPHAEQSRPRQCSPLNSARCHERWWSHERYSPYIARISARDSKASLVSPLSAWAYPFSRTRISPSVSGGSPS